MTFLDWIVRNNISNKIYILAFIVAIIGYTAWQPLEEMANFSKKNEGVIFYICIAFAFTLYSTAYLLSKWNKWRWFPMFVTLICIGRLLKEIYYLYFPEDVTIYDIWDYVSFLITIWVVAGYYLKHQHEKYAKNRENNNSL